jgi:hypothetical protein
MSIFRDVMGGVFRWVRLSAGRSQRSLRSFVAVTPGSAPRPPAGCEYNVMRPSSRLAYAADPVRACPTGAGHDLFRLVCARVSKNDNDSAGQARAQRRRRICEMTNSAVFASKRVMIHANRPTLTPAIAPDQPMTLHVTHQEGTVGRSRISDHVRERPVSRSNSPWSPACSRSPSRRGAGMPMFW